MKLYLETSKIKYFAFVAVMLCIIIQLYLICTYSDAKQLSDYSEYIRLANESLERGHWYPDNNNLHDYYIFAPGVVNFFILQLKLFGSLHMNMWFSFLLNIGIFYFIYSLTTSLFSLRVGYITLCLYALLYSTWWIVVPAGTEIPFLFLSLFGLWGIVKNKSVGVLFCCGVAFAIANWIRPLVVIFFLTSLVILFVRKQPIIKYGALFMGMFITLSMIGFASHKSFGRRVLQSTTSGINLAYTANDKAYGGVASSLVQDTTNLCYIEKSSTYTYAEIDSIYKQRSIDWIKSHPLKYIGLYLVKIPGLFVEDTWPDRAVLPGAGFVDKYVHGQISMSEFVGRFLMIISKSIVYYVICIICLIGLWVQRKSIFSQKGIILIPLVLGVSLTCIFAISPRYHYPFLFSIVIWASFTIDSCLIKKGKNND